MKPIERMAAIFNRELVRLDQTSQAGPLDAADLTRLKLLADSYRKINPTDPDEPDDLQGLSPAELKAKLNATHPAPEDGTEAD